MAGLCWNAGEWAQNAPHRQTRQAGDFGGDRSRHAHCIQE